MFNCQFVKLCLTSYCLIVVFSRRQIFHLFIVLWTVVSWAFSVSFLEYGQTSLASSCSSSLVRSCYVSCVLYCLAAAFLSLTVTRMMQQESRRLHQIGRWVISYMTKPKIFRLQFTSRNDELISKTSGSWAADLRASLASPANRWWLKGFNRLNDSWVWGVWVWCVDRQDCTSQRSEMLCSWSRTLSTSQLTVVTAGQSYTTSFMYVRLLCGTLTLSPECQSARMSKITNDGLTRSGTGCFVAAVPIWQQWASKS